MDATKKHLLCITLAAHRIMSPPCQRKARPCATLSTLSTVWQIHDLYDYEAQPFLLGYQNEEKIRKNGLKKNDFDFKHVIGVSMFGHISLAKHKVLRPSLQP